MVGSQQIFLTRKMKNKFSSGVSMILVLGVIAVLVTIIVPLVSRTVVDIRITKQQEEQARAFSVAETGLEKALVADWSEETELAGIIDGIDYRVIKSDRGAQSVFAYPKPVEKDFPITVWLIGHDDPAEGFDPEADLDPGSGYQADTITLYWGKSETLADQVTTPAIEASFFYSNDSGNSFAVEKYTFDPNNPGRTSLNNFTPALSDGFTVDGEDYQFRANLTSIPCTGDDVCYLMRLRLLYNDSSHPIAVSGVGQIIPRQGECKESVATVQESGITSRLERCTFYKDFPSVFDFVMYSGSTLEKLGP